MSKLNVIKRILVPIQFNQEGEKLLSYAGHLAKGLGAELILLYAAQVPELTYTQQNRIIQSFRQFAERVLMRQYKPGTGFTTFECLVRPSNLRKSIAAAVTEYAVDLVLMEACSLPEDPKERNNHAAGVMEAVTCPVMVVPAAATFTPLQNLVFATDFTDQDPKVLLRIAAFAKQAKAQLTLVQVYTAAQRSQLCQMKTALREVQALLSGYEVTLRLLEEEDMLEGISDFASDLAAEMLVLATQDTYLMERLFSSNYVKTLAYHTQVPLLTFHQHKTKPCSTCCTNCANKQHERQLAELARVAGL
ncbi:universal stress protein [Pontibacter liquoris]|uniref:universal stress protein n=1 Tax=Pontibacter liquoris TaxID=2905677 RepID=UPI001FA7ED8A|nr:universal stress protein [Pontibacter liquoris]